MSYSPPKGRYDQPFYYIYNGSALTDGSTMLNLAISLDPGIGDFILRRSVGWNNLVNVGAGGAYLLKDWSKNPLAGDPLFVENPPTDDYAYPREQFYPDTGKIQFDLVNILRAKGSNPLVTAQVGFMGVRRQSGSLPLIRQPYRYELIPWSYIGNAVVNSQNTASSMFVPVQDYDFELMELRIFYLSFAFLEIPEENFPNIQAVQAGPIGNSIGFTVRPEGVPNQAFSLSVVGRNIIIVPACNSLGDSTTTIGQVVAAINSNLPASALVTASVPPGMSDTLIDSTAETFLQGGEILTGNQCTMNVFDPVRFIMSNIPILDIYLNRVGPYQNGAIVPSMLFPVSTSLHIDFFTVNPNATFQAQVEFVGRNRIPC